MEIGALDTAMLVSDGTAAGVVVLAGDPHPQERLAADEIVLYVEKMSGARLPVLAMGVDRIPPGQTRIMVGSVATENVPDLDVRRAAGTRPNTLYPPDGFVLRVSGSTIALAGPNPSGTLYAAYELLERLGCRWFWPGELGEVVPTSRTIHLEPFETVQVPSLENRQIRFTGEPDPENPQIPNLNRDASAHTTAWLRRNRLSLESDIPLHGHHRLSHSLHVGGPQGLRDPAVLDEAVRQIMREVEANPDERWFSLGWSDSNCEVDDEQAMGIGHPWTKTYQSTDAHLRFVNRVAQRVLEKYPDRRFGILAYVNYMVPPVAVSPHPSLAPYIAPIESCRRHVAGCGECWQRDAVLQIIKGWCDLSDKVTVYDYEPNFLIDAGVPMPCVSRLRVELPMMCRFGLRGFTSQT